MQQLCEHCVLCIGKQNNLDWSLELTIPFSFIKYNERISSMALHNKEVQQFRAVRFKY